MASPELQEEGDSGTDCECVCCGGGGGGGGGAGREGCGSLWRVALAEALGAALLLLLTCLASCAHGVGGGGGGGLQRALTAGLSVTLVVQCFDHISGAQVNPAVTLAALLTGRVGAHRAAAMVGAQVAGALVGVGLAAAVGGDAGACVSRVGAVGAGHAAVLEALAAGALALANCAAWDARGAAHTDSWPLRVGFIVAALTLTIGEATGASMNPARSVAPALWAARWDHLWVYWVGPLSGAGAAAALYRAVWGPAVRAPLHPPPPHPARAGTAPRHTQQARRPLRLEPRALRAVTGNSCKEGSSLDTAHSLP